MWGVGIASVCIVCCCVCTPFSGVVAIVPVVVDWLFGIVVVVPEVVKCIVRGCRNCPVLQVVPVGALHCPYLAS